MDDDDEERSTSIPSRTKIGKRAAAIEKFPALGAPLILFGGLITIPMWGYRNTPVALLEVMLSDLPRVVYNSGKITDNDIKEAEDRTKNLRERVKKHGLGINFSNKVNTNDYVSSKIKGE